MSFLLQILLFIVQLLPMCQQLNYKKVYAWNVYEPLNVCSSNFRLNELVSLYIFFLSRLSEHILPRVSNFL